jgi:hypothetical protein
MRLYPARPAGTLVADVAVVLAVLLLGWAGLKVHDAIAGLAGVGRGLEQSGRSLAGGGNDLAAGIRGGFDSAANAAVGAPVVGGDIAGALRQAGRSAATPLQGRARQEARTLIATGADVRRETQDTATLLGLVTFLVPAGVLLGVAIPARVRRVRRLNAAARILDGAPARELARRAAYGLPYAKLARRTEDPLGDLAAGQLEALLEALRDDAGVPVRTYRR